MSSLQGARVFVAIVIGLQLATEPAARGQATGKHDEDHPPFGCTDNGLTRQGSSGFGSQLLAKYEVPDFPHVPLFWHITTFPTRAAAESAKGRIAFVVDAANQVLLYTFNQKDAAPKQGKAVASVGPLQLPSAKSYEVVSYFVVMPAGANTDSHTHPGPEAWYLLAGAQCLETPAGVTKGGAGEGMVAPPNTPMRLSNPGSTTRRALFIVIHDASRPWNSSSDWKPSGACER